MGLAPHEDLYGEARMYDSMFSWDPSTEVQYVIEVARHFRAGDVSRVLDVGCGTGRVAAGFRGLGYDVLCLDLSYEMCSYARRTRALEVVVADAVSIPLREASMDLAYSFLAVLNHLSSLASLEEHLREVWRVLRGGGVYVADLVVNTPDCVGVCDEWETRLEGQPCVVRHAVKEVEGRYFTEVLEIKCVDGTRRRFESRLHAPGASELVEVGKRVGFDKVVFLKPFKLEVLSEPRGRAFMVLVKPRSSRRR